jgi:hypothetical protein
MTQPTCVVCGHGGDDHRFGEPIVCTSCPDRTCQNGPDGEQYRREVLERWRSTATTKGAAT